MNFFNKFNKLIKRKIDYKKILVVIGIILMCGVLVVLNQNKSSALYSFKGTGKIVNSVVSGQPDSVAPTLTITSPTSTDSSNPTKATGTSYTVSGTATDASGIKSVTINGTSVTVSSNGSFSKDITLENGSTKTITIVATDNAGNTKTETRYVRYNSVFYLQNLDGSATETFEFEEGMTWKEFIESSYNSEGLFILDNTTSLTLYLKTNGFFSGSTMTGAVGYNGFVISTNESLKNDVLDLNEFILLSADSSSDAVLADELLIESGKTYYCDGVGYIEPEVPEELYIYQAGNTSWKNVIESSYSTTKTKATFGSSNVSIATSAYLGYAYLKVDFTNYDKLSITGYGGTVGYSSDKASFIESQQLSSSCEFDISNLSGEYYIMIRVTQVTPTTITQIKLG